MIGVFKKRNQLTDRQKILIDKLIESGWGRRKFAKNVLAQGWCSSKQEDAMCNMWNEFSINRHRARMTRRPSSRRGNFSDLSDMRDYGYEGHPGQFDGGL